MHNKQEKECLNQIGTRLRLMRLEKGFSQEGFAKHSGYDRSYIGGIERGERNVSILALIKIARSLGVSISALLEGI